MARRRCCSLSLTDRLHQPWVDQVSQSETHCQSIWTPGRVLSPLIICWFARFLILLRLLLVVSLIPTWNSSSGQQLVDCMRLGSLLVTYLIWAPSKQRISLDSASVWQRVTYYYHPSPFLSWACYTGSRLSCLTQLQLLSWCGGLSSSVCRVVKQLCTSSSSGSLFLLLVLAIASFHSSALLAPLPSVCPDGGGFSCL